MTFEPLAAEVDLGLTRASIDQKTCVPIKIDFHRGDAVRKQRGCMRYPWLA